MGARTDRTATGQEVDIVLENGATGSLAGIEVKASATITRKDLSGLRALAEDAADRFNHDVILYTGEKFIPLLWNIVAMPLSALWTIPD